MSGTDKVSDGFGLKHYRSRTGRKPLDVRVYANGDVYVAGRGSNAEIADMIKTILRDR